MRYGRRETGTARSGKEMEAMGLYRREERNWDGGEEREGWERRPLIFVGSC